MDLLNLASRPVNPRHRNKFYKKKPGSDSPSGTPGGNTGQFSLGNVPNVFNQGVFGSKEQLTAFITANANGIFTHPSDASAVYEYLTGQSAAGVPIYEQAKVIKAGINKIIPSGNPGIVSNLGDFGLSKSIKGYNDGSGNGVSASSAAVAAETAAINAARLQNATVEMNSWLNDHGLANLIPQANSIVQQYGGRLPAATIAEMLKDTPEWHTRFAGNDIRTQNGLTPLSPDDYVKMENGYSQVWSNAGIDPKLLSPQAKINMIGGDVATTEFENRVKMAQRAVNQSDQSTLTALNKYHGINSANVTAFMLDPKFTTTQWENDLAQAQVGGAGKQAGFGLVSANQASEIAKAGYSQSQAQAGFEKIAPLQALEQAQVGQRGQAVTTRKQLVGSEFTGAAGSMGVDQTAAKAARQRSIEARGAGLSGGGTFAAGTKGVVGAGRASTEGTGNA